MTTRGWIAIAGFVSVALTTSTASAQKEAHYVLDGFGGVHAGGGAPAISPSTPYFGFDVAVDMTYIPAYQTNGGEAGILVLDAFGGVHAGGPLKTSPRVGKTPYFGFDVARAIVYRDRRPQVFSALVNASGTLVQGSDATVSATRLSEGTYVVSFNRSLVRCAFVVGIGRVSTSTFSSLTPVVTTVRTALFTGGNAVIYQVLDAFGGVLDADANLIVTCAQP